ncbi:RNA-dependent RNA polymerase family protein [Paraburkholderia sediminicola]|uniref:hypothetical protein n=1 Tax=Paraburkholderia sediminicola TaxID=458836 RepID=UPI0038BBA801
MSSSSLQFVTYAIADAMLAGPPEATAMVERMTLVLGERADWMNGLARRVATRFGSRWDSVDSKELSKVVAENAGFVSAWRGENQPRVVRVLARPPFQRPPPPWLHDVALPQLPTLGDLAAWLEVEPDELDWFADRWRVPAQSAATPLHHYSYKVIEKRDGRCRIIEVPKSRLRALQRKVLHGLLDRVPAYDAVHGFRRGRNASQNLRLWLSLQTTVARPITREIAPYGTRVSSWGRTHNARKWTHKLRTTVRGRLRHVRGFTTGRVLSHQQPSLRFVPGAAKGCVSDTAILAICARERTISMHLRHQEMSKFLSLAC